MENNRWIIYPSISHNYNYFGGKLATVTDKNVTLLIPKKLQKYYKKNNCKEAVVPKYKCLLLKDEFTYDDVVSWYKPYLKEHIKLYSGTEMYFFTSDGIPLIGRVINQTSYGVTLQVQFEQFGILRFFTVKREYNQIIPVGIIESYM